MKVLIERVVESQLQIGRFYPECSTTLWGCVASGSRRMWHRFGRRHEGFADLSDILSRYIESFTPLILPHLPPVLVGFLNQHVAFPLVDGDEAVLGLVFIIVLHLDVDLARGNRQFRHVASYCPPGSSPQEEDVYYHGFQSKAEGNTNKFKVNINDSSM